MPRGGARPGAGRKKGTVSEQSKRKRELAVKVETDGVTPLEVMAETMRGLWAEANFGGRVNIGKRMQACAIAKDLAPYIHPKLSAVEHAGPDGGPIQTEQTVTAIYELPDNGRD